jgi:cytidylate kinase
VLLDGEDVTDQIRTPEVSLAASKVAVVPEVRRILVAEQRRAGHHGGGVMEGRDIGTVVCPEASVKIFLDASPAERARRRAAELSAGGAAVDLALMEREIAERDHRDRTRAHSPLRPAADAHVVDTTGRALEEVVAQVLSLARRRQDP